MMIQISYKKFTFYLLLFLIIVILTFGYTCFCLDITGDEIWNYGFSYNISNGLIIYRDFNVLQTPLYFFLGSVFIQIIGNYLISLHLMDAIIISLIFFMLFKIMRWNSFVVCIFILTCALPSYNLLCLFFIILILYLVHFNKDNNILIGFIIGLLFLTKQNIGICVFVIYFIFSKVKLKSIISFLIPIFVFGIYLIYYGDFYDFINYCFLGMLDFGEKNSNFVNEILVSIEVLILLYLIFRLTKSKFCDKTLWYVFVFQMMLYPIVDLYHFLIFFVLIVFFTFKRCKNTFYF